MKTKVGFVSLGCPKNQLDTEVMLHKLVEAGYEITAEDIEADVIIVNTCAFIESAKQESIDNILDVAWLKENKNLKGIVVCGCLAQRYKEEVAAEMPEVDALLGVGSLDKIVDAVRAVENGGEKGLKYSDFGDIDTCPLGGDRVVTTPEYTAYLKVAEGCDNRCSYCAIPYIRGKFRSRPMDELVAEAKTLEELGVKELIIIAQDTTRYGLDLYGGYKLPELIRQICAETTIPWLRLLYCYPDKITDELVAEIRDNPRVVKYIDIPIQHIDDDILSANEPSRRLGDHTRRDKEAARNVPASFLRTTAITGFPGETEEQFGRLADFIRETSLERFGAFAYSREEGTPAYELPGQVEEQVKQDRADALMEIQLDITAEQNAEKLGKTFEVLVEGYDAVSEAYYGRSFADAPEIDGKIYFTSRSGRKIPDGRFINVDITDVLDYDLVGECE